METPRPKGCGNALAAYLPEADSGIDPYYLGFALLSPAAMSLRLSSCLLVFCCLVLIGCGSAPKREGVKKPAVRDFSESGYPPPAPVDLSKIPEPVPKVEARARYGNHSPYIVLGKRYVVLSTHADYRERGIASWYGSKFHGRLTSTLEPYDMYAFSAAHKTLPLPTYARVTNLENGRSVVVRINDRGPFVGNRIIDLSYVAAVKLDMHMRGTAPVEVEVLHPERANQSAGIANEPSPERASEALAAPAPTVRNPTTATPSSSQSSAVPEPNPGKGWFVQVGAFSASANASMLAARLRLAGFGENLIEWQEPEAPIRLLLGPFENAIDASVELDALKRSGIDGARVIFR